MTGSTCCFFELVLFGDFVRSDSHKVSCWRCSLVEFTDRIFSVVRVLTEGSSPALAAVACLVRVLAVEKVPVGLDFYCSSAHIHMRQRYAVTDVRDREVFTIDTTVIEFWCALYRFRMSNSASVWWSKEKMRSIDERKRYGRSALYDDFDCHVISRCVQNHKYFYIYIRKYSRVRPILIGSIAVHPLRPLCTCPLPGTRGSRGFF